MFKLVSLASLFALVAASSVPVEITEPNMEESFQQCNDNDWKEHRRDFLRVRRRHDWRMATENYDFTLTRFCFFESDCNEPVNISVRNGQVVAPKNAKNLPTMKEIFQLIHDKCFSKCPEEHDFVCDVSYNTAGYVEKLFIDDTFVTSKSQEEEAHYVITNFKNVGEASIQQKI